MDARRQSASPGARHLYRTASLPHWVGRRRLVETLGPALDPRGCHALLSAPGVAAAVTEELLTSVRATAALAHPPPPNGRGHGGGSRGGCGGYPTPLHQAVSVRHANVVAVLSYALCRAVSSCRCADDVVVPALLTAFPDVYVPAQGVQGRGGVTGLADDVLGPFFFALDRLLKA